MDAIELLKTRKSVSTSFLAAPGKLLSAGQPVTFDGDQS